MFATIPRRVREADVLETCLHGMQDSNFGTMLLKEQRSGQTGAVYMWRHRTGPKYWGVVRRLRPRDHVHASYSIDDLMEFANYWFHRKPLGTERGESEGEEE